MKSFPSCWNKTLSQLGFRRKLRKKGTQTHFGRRPLFENLEAREMLSATQYTVSTLEDVAIAGDSTDNRWSLREALNHSGADTQAGIDTITFAPGLEGKIVLSGTQLVLNKDVTIVGPGEDKLTVNGNLLSRVFQINTGVVAKISDLTITRGKVLGVNSGGGILNSGNLTLEQVLVSGNSSDEFGGGLHSVAGSSLVIRDSEFSWNVAKYGGGASILLSSASGNVLIENSTLAQNTANITGLGNSGGILISGPNSLSLPVKIHNSTISSNTAAHYSGGIRAQSGAIVEIVNSTITKNNAPIEAGISSWGNVLVQIPPSVIPTEQNSLVTLQNSIVAENSNNTSIYNNLAGSFGANSSYNLLGSVGNTTFTQTALGNQVLTVGSFAGLAPLGDYGGPTRTHALLPGRPASNAGNTAATSITLDQRGGTRKVGTIDIGAVESQTALMMDIDGDHRKEEFQVIGQTGAILIVDKSTSTPQISKFFQFDKTQSWKNVLTGDFNGDGRADLAAQDTLTHDWAFSLSDGNQLLPVKTTTGENWSNVLVGDFDGDGADEITGRFQAATAWEVVHFNEANGSATLENWGTGLTSSSTFYVGDFNLDGRDDIIAGSTNNWTASISQSTAAGGQFTPAPVAGLANWFNNYLNNGVLDAEGPYRKFLEIFSQVYNEIELELYPGLMKGIDATAQTKAGNAWDQAALLVDRLEAAGFEADIASGKIEVSAEIVKKWIGSPDTSTGTTLRNNLQRVLLQSLGSQVQSVGTKLRFDHAWVEATVPTATGLAKVFLDPSWKFKQRNPGILPTALDGVLIPFDQLDYLTKVRDELALEYYEDKLTDFITTTYPGKSLADVAHDGPIQKRAFTQIPVGMGEGVQVYDSIPTDATDEVIRFGSFDELLENSNAIWQRTHRVTLELKRISSTSTRNNVLLLSKEVVVPDSAFERFTITTSENANPTLLIKELVDGNTVTQTIAANGNLLAGEKVLLTITHLDPWQQVGDLNLSKQEYEENVGTIMAIGLDANQFSSQYVESLQEYLITELSSVDAGDIDDLLSYTATAYWQDFNIHNAIIAGLMNGVYVKDRVGSGVATASAGYQQYEYLPYSMAPDDFGVDLKNGSGSILHWSGNFAEDAIRLTLYNGSGLEHQIVEETIDTESVSTVKGLQRAFQRNKGISSAGTTVTNDRIHGFDSYWNANSSQRDFYYRGEWAVNLDTFTDYSTAILPAAAKRTSAEIQNILSNSLSAFENSIVSALSNSSHHDPIRLLVSDARTKVGEWVGGVFVAESFGQDRFSISMSIAPDNGPIQNGGYSGKIVNPKNSNLPDTNFTHASFAGDPVNTANGNMFRDDVDIVAPNLGVPLNFVRHYDSNNKDDIGLGVGWTYSFGDVIVADPAGGSEDVIWITSTGQRHKFKYTAGVGFSSPADLHGTFSATESNYFYKDTDGTEFHFVRKWVYENDLLVRGRLVTQVDNIGNGVDVIYENTYGDNFRRIDYVRDIHDVNRRLEFDYTAGTVNLTGGPGLKPLILHSVIYEVRQKVNSTGYKNQWNYDFALSNAATTSKLRLGASCTLRLLALRS